jgi:hypothetical protein
MTLHPTLLIVFILMAGWAVQQHRRRHFGRITLALLVSLLGLAFAVRS